MSLIVLAPYVIFLLRMRISDHCAYGFLVDLLCWKSPLDKIATYARRFLYASIDVTARNLKRGMDGSIEIPGGSNASHNEKNTQFCVDH